MLTIIQCRDRENNVCLFTGLANPEACHIIPFAFNSNLVNLARTYALIPAMRLFVDAPWNTLVMGVHVSDKVWNQLAVNRQLHKWWGMGLWAVQCLGITKAECHYILELQFQWMPKRSELRRSRRINLEKGGGQEMLDELTSWYGNPSTQPGDATVVAAHKSFRPLLSGHVFEVKLDKKEDADNMKAMVDLQWALIKMAALAGARRSV